MLLTLSAVVSGFQTYELIEGFGEEKLDWLRKFYPYKYGSPSHDTLGEFFSRIKPKEFAKCLIEFTKALAKHDSKVIALDGKTVKGFLTQDGLSIAHPYCFLYQINNPVIGNVIAKRHTKKARIFVGYP
ncbi:ISAs1 family transposase [Flavobacterium sp. 1]|uniref:ISAs1 family transposase n=1 Tax=Flavobacterium sp. 1 TaxID=2035200 RepID=UPI003514CB5B